jgi:hypothetical protein
MLAAQCCTFGLLVAALVSLAFPISSLPWTHVDLLLKKVLRFVVEFLTGFHDPVEDLSWAASAEERLGLLKYAAFGAILIFLFPLHVLSGSEALIDFLWRATDTVRHFLAEMFPPYIRFSESDWRASAFELWEICVLFWTITVVANVVVTDYVDLTRHRAIDPKRVFAVAGRTGEIKVLVVIIGILILVILENGLLRLIFECSIVLAVLGFDMAFARSYKRLGRPDLALQFFEVMLLIDIPVLIAFGLLILFLVSGQVRGYESHWSSSFVAGASALNLVFTSGSILMMKTAHSYRKARTPPRAQVETA